MKTISIALAANAARQGADTPTLTVCLKITRQDGFVLAATTFPRDFTFEGVLYRAKAGGTPTDVQTSSSLAVSEGEFSGRLTLDEMTEADLRNGLYLGANIHFFQVNRKDLTQGSYTLLKNKIGPITIKRNEYVAALLGTMAALQQAIGRVCTPTCPWKTYDLGEIVPRCRLDEDDFKVTGMLDSVSADGLTFTDSARTEAGPSGGIAILAITNANPGVVTLDSPVPVANDEALALSGILGPAKLNGVAIVRNKSGDTFQLSVDTSDTAIYPAYTGGGIATPLGAESGWFTYGLMRMTHDGRVYEREVKSYINDGTTGQWTLHEKFHFTPGAGDAYEMLAGDDHTWETCKTKFRNGNNFGGFPFVPGQDSVTRPIVSE